MGFNSAPSSKRIDDPKKAEVMARASNKDRSEAVDNREKGKKEVEKPYDRLKGDYRHHYSSSAESSDSRAEYIERKTEEAIEKVMAETKGMSEEALKQGRDNLDKEVARLRQSIKDGRTMPKEIELEKSERKLEVYNDILSGALDREEDKAAKLSQEIKDRM